MRCNNCGNKAVYYRKWEGFAYCKDCFSRQLEKRFRRTMSKNKLLKKGDKVAVALSGGKDSAVLLYLMHSISKDIPIEIFAMSIEEGIKNYRDKSLEEARRLTKSLGVKHFTFSFKKEFGITIDSLKGKKTCTYCGVFKRYILNKESRELGANKLAIGHNLDNEAQSVIMNFMRGDFSRFQRIGAYPILIEDSKFVARIQPIRDIPEDEIKLFAEINKIPFLGGRCPYSYDNLRRDVMNALNRLERKYPGTKLQIVNFYDRIKPFFINETKKDKVNYCRCGEPTSQDVCKACQLIRELKKEKL